MARDSGAGQYDGFRCLEPLPQGPAAKVRPDLAVGSRFSPTPWIRTLRLASVQPSLIISVEPPPGLSLLPHDELPTVSLPSGSVGWRQDERKDRRDAS